MLTILLFIPFQSFMLDFNLGRGGGGGGGMRLCLVEMLEGSGGPLEFFIIFTLPFFLAFFFAR